MMAAAENDWVAEYTDSLTKADDELAALLPKLQALLDKTEPGNLRWVRNECGHYTPPWDSRLVQYKTCGITWTGGALLYNSDSVARYGDSLIKLQIRSGLSTKEFWLDPDWIRSSRVWELANRLLEAVQQSVA